MKDIVFGVSSASCLDSRRKQIHFRKGYMHEAVHHSLRIVVTYYNTLYQSRTKPISFDHPSLQYRRVMRATDKSSPEVRVSRKRATKNNNREAGQRHNVSVGHFTLENDGSIGKRANVRRPAEDERVAHELTFFRPE